MSSPAGGGKPQRYRLLQPTRLHRHDHSHDHDHDHDHDHASGHSHVDAREGDAFRHGNPRLPRGAGRGKLLYFDCFSGVAGDMTVAALIDLGVPLDIVQSAIESLGIPGVEVAVAPAQTGAIAGMRFTVHEPSNQPERSYLEIDTLLQSAALDPDTQRRAREILARLARAEALVHRVPLESVTFHEVGAVDSIADIVGAAAALAFLGAEVVSAPLPLGRGSVVCRHGTLPLPAPATLVCLQGVPTYDAGIEAELVTPTGAAILASQVQRFTPWPELVPLAIGWGAGTKRLPDRPNALRVVLGEAASSQGVDATPPSTHFVLEANVDDITGELSAHAIAKLLEAGALDAWAVPLTMKKGRPGLLISALCTEPLLGALELVMLRETSSIGVRRHGVSRLERPREVVEVETEFGRLPVKVARGPYGPPQLKPEFDACVRAAEAHGVPVRRVLAAALAAAAGSIGL